MAIKTVTATFTGSEEFKQVTWSGVGARHGVMMSVQPSDGFGAVRPWITSHFATAATINVPALWQGKVVLTVFDTPTGTTWPAGALVRAAGPAPNQNTASGGSDVVYHRPFYVPSDVATLIVRMGNRGPVLGGRGNSVTCNVAVYKSDGSGNATGSPLAKWLSQVIPGDGTDWVSPTSVPITGNRGTDGKIVLLYSFPASTNCVVANQCTWGKYSNATTTVDPAPATTGSDPNPPLWVHFDYVTTKRRIVVFGDSISAGCVSATGYEINPWYQLGPQKDYAVAQVSLPGGTLANFAAFGTYPALWNDALIDGVDVTWVQVVVNDLNSGATQMKADMQTIRNRLRSVYLFDRLDANTCAPQGSYPGTETARTTWNTDIKGEFGSVTLGLHAVADFAKPQSQGGLASNADSTKLYGNGDGGSPSFSADTTHWTDAGNNQGYTLVAAAVG